MYPSVYSVGPLIIKVSMVTFFVSLIFSYYIIKYRIKSWQKPLQKLVTDKLFNAFLIGIVVWKFSFILIYPMKAFQFPVSILYFDGGPLGIIFGVVCSGIYVWLQSKKLNIELFTLLELVLIGSISFFTLSSGISIFFSPYNHLLYLISFIIGSIVIFLFLIKTTFPLPSKGLLEAILWWSIFQVLVEYLLVEKYLFIGPFTTKQVLYAIFAIVTTIILVKQSKVNDK